MRILLFLAAVVAVWALVCAFYYFRQESIIFYPARLPAEHRFSFDRPFEEHRIEVEPGVGLSALLFPATGSGADLPSRRVVLYLHGNAGHLQAWGWHAGLYADAGHDFFVVDYRGYGKSDGEIESEAQLHADVTRVWDWLLSRYEPGDVTVVGYSIGAALAARLACETARPPARLVLLAPFFSVRDMARRMLPFVPSGLLRYPLRTDLVLTECRTGPPVTIFHGVDDGTVPPSQGRRLARLAGERARFVPLPGAGHQTIAENPLFRREMRELLGSMGERDEIEVGADGRD